MQTHQDWTLSELKIRRRTLERELIRVQKQMDNLEQELAHLEDQIEILRKNNLQAA